MAAGRGRPDRLPAGADTVTLLRDHARRAAGGRRAARAIWRSGPTVTFARRAAAESGVYVHASLYERPTAPTALGYNTAIVVAPDGRLLSRTRKLHIPMTAGYYEDRYFRARARRRRAVPADGAADRRREAQLGFPTCWDQWFPELARAYSLDGRRGAHLPDRDRLGARPSGLRHPAAVAAGDRRKRRSPTGRSWSRSTGSASRSRSPSTARASSRTPTARVLVQAPRDRPGGAGRRSRSRSAARLAGAVPVPAHPPSRRLRAVRRAPDRDGPGHVAAS